MLENKIRVFSKFCQTVAGISRISQLHIIIFLGLVCVRRYCEFLMEADHVQQVAWYVSQLRNEDQIDLYSQFLSTLKHEADKRLALSLAVENSLPVQDILSQVVKRIHDNEVSFNCIYHNIQSYEIKLSSQAFLHGRSLPWNELR